MRVSKILPFLVATAAVAAADTGCGIPNQSHPTIIAGPHAAAPPSALPQPGTPESARIQVYFVDSSNRVMAITRLSSLSDLPAAIGLLLAGPTTAESSAGISSAIPAGTKLDSVHQAGGTAILDFSDALASVSGHEQLLAFAQIVLTADSLPAVDRVQISVEGQAVNAPEPDGTLAEGPVTAQDYNRLVAPQR